MTLMLMPLETSEPSPPLAVIETLPGEMPLTTPLLTVAISSSLLFQLIKASVGLTV